MIEKVEIEKTEQDFSLQEYLSLGYIYLIVVGSVTDAIYYNAIGINILSYSSFLDILITPINLLMNNFIIPAMLAIMGSVLYFGRDYIFRTKKGEKEPTKLEKNRKVLFSFAFMVFGFYTGLGLGMSSVMPKRIQDKNIKINTNITFNNGKNLNVAIVGQNSTFIFYVVEGTSEVVISPIANTIWQMKKIKK